MPYLKSIQAFVALGLLSLVTVACVHDPMRYDRQSHVSEAYIDTVNEPDYYQPWGYYYYPDSQVYFHYSSGYYYYISNDGQWAWSRILPPRYRLNPRARVQLHIENDKPYLFHDKHIQRYRPDRRYLPTPDFDRRERDHNRDWHERQSRIKDKKHITPPSRSTRPTPHDSREPGEIRQNQPQPIPRVDRKERDDRRDDSRDEKRDKKRDDNRDDNPNRHQPQPNVKEHIEVILPPDSARPIPRDMRNRKEIRQPQSMPKVDPRERENNRDRRQPPPHTNREKNAVSPPGFTNPSQRLLRERKEASAPKVTPNNAVGQPQKGKSGTEGKQKAKSQKREVKGQVKQKDKKSKPQGQDEEQGEQEAVDTRNSKKYRREGDEERKRN